MSLLFRQIILVTLGLSVSACASAGDYPSLARRDVERIGNEPAAPPPTVESPPQAPSSTVVARLSTLVEQARAAHGRFLDRRTRAERQVAGGSGAAIGSENWSVAAVALADLE
ncbi:MAG: hypothetical protein WCY11_10135, partial [Novosphingobium sp.]